MGITKGRLPTTVTVDPYTGHDAVPIMKINSVSHWWIFLQIVPTQDEEYYIVSSSWNALHACGKWVDDNDQAFRQVKGHFYVLDRIQNVLIAVQNMLFSG